MTKRNPAGKLTYSFIVESRPDEEPDIEVHEYDPSDFGLKHGEEVARIVMHYEFPKIAGEKGCIVRFAMPHRVMPSIRDNDRINSKIMLSALEHAREKLGKDIYIKDALQKGETMEIGELMKIISLIQYHARL